jgi:hypothetical protein
MLIKNGIEITMKEKRQENWILFMRFDFCGNKAITQNVFHLHFLSNPTASSAHF